jgi:hypothetical protein
MQQAMLLRLVFTPSKPSLQNGNPVGAIASSCPKAARVHSLKEPVPKYEQPPQEFQGLRNN